MNQGKGPSPANVRQLRLSAGSQRFDTGLDFVSAEPGAFAGATSLSTRTTFLRTLASAGFDLVQGGGNFSFPAAFDGTPP